MTNKLAALFIELLRRRIVRGYATANIYANITDWSIEDREPQSYECPRSTNRERQTRLEEEARRWVALLESGKEKRAAI
jgi:hypothetical protein